jgi:squalene-hopene/tetraprenyl-beta-curcumene cyclase
MNVVALVLLLAPAADAAGEQVSAERLREAVQRSVPFLEAKGQEWIEERNCVSCHQVPLMLWSLRAALEHGIAVDEAKLRDTFAWAGDARHFADDTAAGEFDENSVADKNIDTMYALLLAKGYDEEAKRPAWTTSFRQHLAKRQRDDGSWRPCGQLPTQRRPLAETTEVATMWTLLALREAGEPDEALNEKVQEARKLLDQGQPGQSTEWWAVRLLLERRVGDDERADQLCSELKELQHEDGGWGWLAAEKSDAFATGLALYALSGESLDEGDVRRAHKFLLETQQDDGSWCVPSTQKRFNGAVKPTSTYWGTAWAVIGILNTLP